MIIARQSTARTVTVGPVLDADGVAVTDLAVGDLKISKNGGAPAGLNGSATLTHRNTGHYSLALTTSDTDTVGQAEIVIDDTTNAMPVKEITVLEEAVYDALFAASATGALPVSGTVTVGTNNDKTGYSLTNLTVGSGTTLASGTHNPQGGDAYAYLGTNLGALGANATEAGGTGDHLTALATAAAQATAQSDLDILTGSDGVTLATSQPNYAPAVAGDEMDLVDAPNATAVTAIQNGLATSSALGTVDSNVDAILADTDELQGDWADGGRLDLILDARASQASVDDLPTNAELTSALGGLNDLDATEVQTAAAAALTAYDPPTKAELDAAVEGLKIAEGTIGATGNSTTTLHLDGLTYGDDELNDLLLVILDDSTGEKHPCWITDWVASTELATVATLPFTPEDSTDRYWILPVRQDVTGGSGLDAAGVRAAIGLASANLDTQLETIDSNVDAIKAVTDELPDAGALTSLAQGSDLATVDSNVDAILEDTGTTLPATLSTIDGNVDAILEDTGTTLPGTLSTIAGYLDTEIAAIKAVTDNLPDSGALTSLAQAADLATVDSNVDAILEDTGTTLPAELDGIQADTEDIQSRLPAALVSGRIDASVGAMATNSLTAAALHSDAVTEIQSGLATASALETVDANVDTLLVRITSTLFSGITSMAQWLGAIAGKQTPNSTAQTEIRATGAGSGTFNPTTDSLEALRDRGDSAWTTSTLAASDITGGTTVAQAVTSIKGSDGDDLKDLSDEIAAVKTEVDKIPRAGETHRFTNTDTNATADVEITEPA